MPGIYVGWLPDAARETGYPVIEAAGWRLRGHGGFRAVEGVVAHHTGTSNAARGDYPSLNIVTVGRSDLPGPLCNYGLGRSGTIYVVAAGVAWHAGASKWAGFTDLNDEFLGIEAESAGAGSWSPQQLDAYPKLVAAILRYLRRGTDRYISHRGCALPAGRKPDPTGITDVWMRERAAGLTATPPPPATGKDELMIDMRLDVDREDLTFIGSSMAEAGGGSQVVDRAWVTFGSTFGHTTMKITALGSAGALAQWDREIPNNTSNSVFLPPETTQVTIEGEIEKAATRPVAAVVMHPRP